MQEFSFISNMKIVIAGSTCVIFFPRGYSCVPLKIRMRPTRIQYFGK